MLALVIPLGLFAALISLAIAFGNADQTARVAEDAIDAQFASNVTVSTGALRTSFAVAFLLHSEAEVGDDRRFVSEKEVQQSLAAARQALSTFAEQVDALGSSSSPSAPALIEAGANVELAASEIMEALERSDLDAAQKLITDELSGRLGILDGLATAMRDDAFQRAQAEGSQQGAIARATSIGVGLVVPALALYLMRNASRRRRALDALQAEELGKRQALKAEKRAQEIEQERQKQLLEAQLSSERAINRTKDDMIAGLSHELRTPLAGIYGASLILDDVGFEDERLAREMNDTIIGEAWELTRMVDDLLTAATTASADLSIRLTDVDIVTVVQEVASVYARRGVEVDVRCDPGHVAADEVRLRQVIGSLVSNAEHHGGEETKVIGSAGHDGYTLVVADNGRGVKPEIVGRLFDPFINQGESALTAGSVGLGLATARHITEAMGGTIEYRRSDGLTRFVVTLPLAYSSALADQEDVAASATRKR